MTDGLTREYVVDVNGLLCTMLLNDLDVLRFASQIVTPVVSVPILDEPVDTLETVVVPVAVERKKRTYKRRAPANKSLVADVENK